MSDDRLIPSINLLQALLEVSESIASHHDLSELFHDLAARITKVVSVDFVNLILHDAGRDVMRLHILETPHPHRIEPGLEFRVGESPGGWVWQTQQPLVIASVAKETRFPKILPLLREHGVNSLYMVPLTTARRRLGSMGFGSLSESHFTECDIRFLEQVGKQVAVAVDNALNYQSLETSQQQLARERDRLRLLLEVNNAVVASLELPDVFAAIAGGLRRVMPDLFISLTLYDPQSRVLRLYALDLPVGREATQECKACPVEGSPAGVVFASGKPAVFDEADLHRMPSEVSRFLLAEGVKSVCCVPLISHAKILGTLNLASPLVNAFTADDVELLTQVANQIAIAVENALGYREIAELKDKLNKEKLYLEGEIQSEYNFEEIVGESAPLKEVLKQVEVVAPTDSTVLILGETGTGKELIARAIHNRSGRRGRTFVKLNCAAIPSGLLESDLFGHEKGAFTGAIAQKLGRFELADDGTLFLDEVGDIPLELQSKLLRVLQEQEFERLGSTRTIRVNVRLIAATNHDLGRMVTDKDFRSDLYYRLNVFPVTVPPLRERQEDIPLLVRYFAQKFAQRMNKRIETITTETMTALSRYHWPGNIRELENLVERAVILSQGSTLHVPLAELKDAAKPDVPPVATLEAAEREHITRVLQSARWVIGGPNGAAAKLGMKRTTLQSKMQKLGIARPQ